MRRYENLCSFLISKITPLCIAPNFFLGIFPSFTMIFCMKLSYYLFTSKWFLYQKYHENICVFFFLCLNLQVVPQNVEKNFGQTSLLCFECVQFLKRPLVTFAFFLRYGHHTWHCKPTIDGKQKLPIDDFLCILLSGYKHSSKGKCQKSGQVFF